MTDSPRATAADTKVFAAPFPWPVPDDDVLTALQAAYADGSWGKYHAEHCTTLAKLLREYHAVEHVRLCCSGTMAVELALRGGKIGPGDEVILGGYDFPGNFRAIEATGARPVLIDLAEGSWCLDPQQIEPALSAATKAILVSHLHGTLADMPPIIEIACRRGLFVVEDACQVPGALVAGKPAGSWGDAGVLSFGGSKLVTAGRGGAMMTRHADVAQRIAIFADRGNDSFPLSELQAAVLVPQWQKLDERNAIRARQVARIQAAIETKLQLQPASADSSPAYYKVGWLLRGDEAYRERYVAKAQSLGLPLDAGFRGFTRRSATRCRIWGELPQARRAATATTLMHHPLLLQSDETVDRLIAALRALDGFE